MSQVHIAGQKRGRSSSRPPASAERSVSTGKRPIPRALIVDDTRDSRELYGLYLRNSGWQVEDATNGEEALAIAAAFAPSVIVMDLSMPVLDGIETTRLLKKDPRTRHVPIVALTAFADPLKEVEARAAGCQAFVAKPCLPDQLLMVLEDLVRRNNGG
jgi:CheY-like chemotaxis protein